MKAIARIKIELRYYRMLAFDSRTPRLAKWLLAGAVAYVLMPFDIIPDFIPLLGQLDDVIIVPAMIGLGLMLIPASLKTEVRRLATEQPPDDPQTLPGH